MKWFKQIFELLHFCIYSKPIISRYISFNSRDIIYECRCGKRKVINVCRNFGDDFPIETTNFLTDKEFNEQIKNNNYENVPKRKIP